LSTNQTPQADSEPIVLEDHYVEEAQQYTSQNDRMQQEIAGYGGI